MKNTMLLAGIALCMISLFYNCKNESTAAKEANADSTSAADAAAIAGYWINDAYWQVLQNTKSPRKASEKAGIAAILIRQDTGNWVADLIFNWHEGNRYNIQSDEGKLALYNTYEIGKKEFDITAQPDGSLHLDTAAFVRIGDAETGQAAISASLLAGNYELKGTATAVKLNPDGTVSGLDDFTRYEVSLDYVTEDIGSEQMMFYKGDDQPVFHAYQMKGNELIISEIVELENEEYPPFKVGKVKYALVKK